MLGATQPYNFKNRIINGAMTISQYNGTSSGNNAGAYMIDRWYNNNSQSGKLTYQQNAGSVSTPVGFPNYLGITSASAYSVGSGDYFFMEQRIEGFNFADCNWGTANAKTVTLSFQVYSSLTGTFGGALTNGAQDKSYPFTYSIPVANTWTSVSITIAGDTTGTWIGATNGIGLRVRLSYGSGSSFSGTAGSWAGANYTSATGAVSVVGTSGATFYITGVQLELGVSATSFDYRAYGQELALCQRYFYASPATSDAFLGAGFGSATTTVYAGGYFPTTMRAQPTLSTQGSTTGTVVTTAGIGGSISLILGPTTNVNGWYAQVVGTSTYPNYAYVMIRGSTAFQLTASAEL
jgi:hypothetical protein